MKIRKMTQEDLSEIVEMWNDSCQKELVYKPIDEYRAKEMFLKTNKSLNKFSFVSYEKAKLTGFSSGTIVEGRNHGYLTTVIIDRNYQNRGIGTQLLEKIENKIKFSGLNNIRIDYSNPVSIPWFIPGTSFDHPCAPGVDMTTIGENFLLSHGYRRRTEETSMGMKLIDYKTGEDIYRKEKKLKELGILIEIYDPKKHSGLEEFLDSMGSESWKKILLGNSNSESPLPLPIASYNGKISGFAGPISVEPGGRGWFAGIGISPLCRGLGVGSVLFNYLCRSFKDSGAKFITLFTGIDNISARNIYLKAGLRILRHWSLMEKEI